MLPKLIYLAYFFLFFVGIQIHILGITVFLGDVFAAITVVLLFVKRPSLLRSVKTPLLFFCLYFLITVFRNGGHEFMRIMVVSVKYGFFWLVYYSTFSLAEKYGNVIIKSLVTGLKISAIIGIVQFVIFFLSGVDLFPINIFNGGDRSAVITSLNWLRVTAMNGEPKSLGFHMVLGTLMLMYNPKFVKHDHIWKLVFGIVALLTLSTSALFLMFVVYVAYCFKLKINLRHISYLFLILLVIFFNKGLVNRVLDLRFFSRVQKIEDGVEDYDHVISQSLLDKPYNILFGKGVGLSHIGISEFIKSEWSHYITKDTKVIAKSGILHVTAEFGLIGLLLIIVWMYKNTNYNVNVSFFYSSIVLTLLFFLRGTYFIPLYVVLFQLFQFVSMKSARERSDIP